MSMFRSPKLLQIARDVPRCMGCSRTNIGNVVAAHSNQLRDGKGRGLKAADYRIAFLCDECHHELDQGVKWSKAERVEFWEMAHRNTIGWLFENGRLVIA